MGACETLNPAGLGFLADLGAPFTDAKGIGLRRWRWRWRRMGGIQRGSTRCWRFSRGRVTHLPDTPMMAFHRGDVARLKDFLRRDPGLIERRFSCLGNLSAGTGLREGWTVRNALDAD